MYRKFFLLTTILFLASFLYPHTPMRVFAQEVGQSDIALELSPQSPGAFEDVTLSLKSYLVNLDKYTISWSVNGELIKTGIGEKSLVVQTGAVGSKKTVSIEIRQGFTEIIKTVVLSPNEVDLLWEGNSYVPPFYKGLPLATQEGSINVVAIPNFKDKKNIRDGVFNWYVNNDPVLGSSGYKKDSFNYNLSYLRADQSIGVVVDSITSGEQATKEMKVFPIKPKILFYEKSPLYGLDLTKLIYSGYTPKESQTTIFAVPYYFSSKDLKVADLNFIWKINNSSITTPAKKNVLTVKPISNDSGIATIDLSVQYFGKLFEDATNKIQLTLNQQ